MTYDAIARLALRLDGYPGRPADSSGPNLWARVYELDDGSRVELARPVQLGPEQGWRGTVTLTYPDGR